MRCLHPQLTSTAQVTQVRFDRIMPLLQEGEADAGVAIHEGRFTYASAGLVLLDDLGARWEQVKRLG